MISDDMRDLEGDGEWGSVVNDALIQIHSIVLPDGKVFAFGTDGTTGDYDARFVYSLYDPATGELKVLPNTTGTNIFCSNMSIDPNTGNVIIMGGDNHNTGEGGGTWSGRNDVVIFDYETETIRNISEEDPAFALNEARWYGTTINLSNGDILILGGRDEDFNGARSVEIYNHETGVRQLSGIDIPDMLDGDGTLTGVYYYPHVWQLSDGSVIMIESGGTTTTGHDVYRLDVDGEGSIETIGTLPFPTRNLTSSIMYEPDKVIVASTTGEVWKADLSQPTPSWELAFTITDEDGSGDMIARTNGTFTMLPDGRVAMIGGSSSAGLLGDSLANAQRTVFFWDPDTGETSYSAPQDLARMYHSSGIILPTGEIYSGGSGSPGPQENANFQTLAPDYLFDENGDLAERPVILQAPSNVDAGSSFRITVDDTSDIGMISFIKSGASTHARNADARFMELDYTIIDGNTIEIEIPDANVAIPGLWMLFVLDNDGVPSVASMTGVDMVDLVDTGGLDARSTMVYNIDNEQIDGAFALAVTVRFEDLNGSAESQTVFELLNSTSGDYVRLSQVGNSTDIEFVIRQDGQIYRIVASDAIVEGEEAVWRVGVDPDGVMRITKNANVLVEGQGVVPADIDRDTYLIGESSLTDGDLVGLVRDLKIANYGNFAELDPDNDASPCAATGEAMCLCNKLVPDVDDTEGNDAAVVFEDYSILQGDVVELENGSRGENQTVLTSTGIIAFADADTTDTHTATLVPQGNGYLGVLTIAPPTTTTETKTGSVTWTFTINDADMDALEEGEQRVQLYDITISDGNGGVTTQTISVTLTGTDDSVPTEEDFIQVDSISPTSGDDTIILGDNVRLMNGDYFEGGENRFIVGNYFELRNGDLDFDNSDNAAHFETGLRPRLFGNDIRMDEGGISNTLILGNVAEFSHIKMDGNGANTRNSITIGNSSKSDAGIDIDSSGTYSDWAQIDLNIGNVVEIGGYIDADGYYASRDFDFGYLVTIHGPMYLNGGYDTSNDVKIGVGFTLEGAWYGSYGVDVVEIGKDWDIDGAVYLYGGDDTLKLGTTTTDASLTYFFAGAGTDTLILDVNDDDLASFEAAARAIGWVALGNDKWDARSLDLNWNGMYLFDFENIEINVIGRNETPTIVESGTTNEAEVTELPTGDPQENSLEHLVNGEIQFADVNPSDTHTVTIVPDGDNYLGEIRYTQPTSAQFGLLPWVFAVNDADLDGLGEGDVVTQTYTVTITDSEGAAVSETITITLNGTEDTSDIPPVVSISAPADVAEGDEGESGTLTFTLTLDKIWDVDVVAQVNISGSATGPTSITIPAGASTADLILTYQGNNDVGGDEPIVVTLTDLQNATAGSISAEVTLLEDDSTVIRTSENAFIDGGDGVDTFVVAGSASEYEVALDDNDDVVIIGPDGGRSTITNFEFIYVEGDGDTYTMDEVIAYAREQGQVDTPIGATEGDDLIEAPTEGRFIIDGLGGEDTLQFLGAVGDYTLSFDGGDHDIVISGPNGEQLALSNIEYVSVEGETYSIEDVIAFANDNGAVDQGAGASSGFVLYGEEA